MTDEQDPKLHRFNSSIPGSVQYQIRVEGDENLARKEYFNRLKYAGDIKAMDLWARDGFVSVGKSHDIREGDERPIDD